MRILYLNPLGALGGAERALLDLIVGLRSLHPDWNFHLISSGDGPFVERSRALGVECGVLKFPAILARAGDSDASDAGGLGKFAKLGRWCGAGLAGTAYVASLRAEIRRVAPDIIHTNGFKMHVAGAFADPAGVPVIWHVRDYVSTRPVMAKVLPRLGGRIAAAIANSQSVADDLKKVSPDLVVLAAHDAIDLEQFSPQGSALDLDRLARLSDAPEGTIRVGLLATLAHWKGHEIFLKAFSKLTSNSIRGYIIGGPLYETTGSQLSLDALRTLAGKLGVLERVGFTGFVADPAAAIRALDIVVHASTRPEPFGLTIAEALASGRPLITTGCGGAAELVRDEVDALIAAPGDVDALAQCIMRLASDVPLRYRLAANGRDAAQARFSRSRLAAQVAELYRNVMVHAE